MKTYVTAKGISRINDRAEKGWVVVSSWQPSWLERLFGAPEIAALMEKDAAPVTKTYSIT